MKKLFLLAASALVGFGADAQYAKSVGGSANEAVYPYQIKNNFTPVAKSTAGGSRWYDHYAMVADLTSAMTNSLMPIWFDSTVKQNFTNGFFAINYSSALQVVDPIYFTLWSDVNSQYVEPTDITIQPWNTYEVDSISFAGAYVKNLNRSVNIVDTLIISVSPTGEGTSNWPYYYASVGGGQAWASNYVATSGPDSLLRGFTILDVDSLSRASGVLGRSVWKVPLFDADRQEDSSGFVSIQSWTLPVMVGGAPGSVSIPAGKGVAVTVTFKSGDVWPLNQDTFTEYHHFALYEGQGLGTDQYMQYYYYNYGDRNMSNLMFSTDTANYYPAIFIEGNNAPSFRYEHHYIGAHIVCNDCFILGVNDVNASALTSSQAYPNPATSEVNVSFTVNATAKATVTLTNSVGQVVGTQSIDATATKSNIATFNTSNLATGVYFYSVEVNGQRNSGRIAVAH
ncbi:MAG: T9SS type A sorting domain-containing protein [Flavipsychrobacter sp.]|nr:T9SS type A sorting domain-containing protein [Flavipsychrobacter sp.]